MRDRRSQLAEETQSVKHARLGLTELLPRAYVIWGLAAECNRVNVF